MVHCATDGESYGHHSKFGDMALAAALDLIERERVAALTNYGAFLAGNPPAWEVEIQEATSWSCAHGLERWRNDCGCRTRPDTHQRWRAPLRGALDWLREQIDTVFEQRGSELLKDPWAARDEYIDVILDRSPEIANAFIARHQRMALDAADLVDARRLLEMQRNRSLMFTSCGWFFDDVAGIETAQILKYAGHAIELAGSGGAALTGELVERLARARSNDAAVGTGREVYHRSVRKASWAAASAAAAYAAMRAVAPEARPEVGCFIPREDQDTVTVTHGRTGRVRRFRVRVALTDGPRLVGLVTGPDGDNESRVRLADFPERARETVRAALRRRLVARWLRPEQTAPVANGEEPLADVAGRALVQAVEALANGAQVSLVEEAHGLADLLELLGQGVPFDAQTRFARIRDQAGPERAAALAPLGRRLGFA